MQPRTLKIIAFVLIGLSGLLAVVGYRLSQQEPVAQQTGPAMPYQVVVAARDIAANATIGAGDVDLIPYPFKTAGTYQKSDAVVGKTSFSDIRQGEVLSDFHFAGRSLLAGQVSAGYRAMGVTVDETIGTGGYLQPGDRVDVIFSSRASRETNNTAVARRVLRDIKVLAFGNDIQGDKGKEISGKKSRTAVLEVSEGDVSKLLLAETTGTLRLVAIGERDGERNIGAVPADTEKRADDKATTLRDLTGWKGNPSPQPTVYVYSGDRVETVRTTP